MPAYGRVLGYSCLCSKIKVTCIKDTLYSIYLARWPCYLNSQSAQLSVTVQHAVIILHLHSGRKTERQRSFSGWCVTHAECISPAYLFLSGLQCTSREKHRPTRMPTRRTAWSLRPVTAVVDRAVARVSPKVVGLAVDLRKGLCGTELGGLGRR